MEQETEESEAQGQPSLSDYLAGAMLANGFIWIWNQMLASFSEALSAIPIGLLADASLVIYVAGATVSSKQVCKRADKQHLIVGLKFACYSWALSLLIMLSMAPDPKVSFAISLLISLAAGGLLGAYWAIKDRLASLRDMMAVSKPKSNSPDKSSPVYSEEKASQDEE